MKNGRDHPCVREPGGSVAYLKYIAASTIILAALLPCTAVHQLHAQDEPIFTWPGSVQVSTSTLTIREGETVSYMVRLTEQPVANDWWLFVPSRRRGLPRRGVHEALHRRHGATSDLPVDSLGAVRRLGY